MILEATPGKEVREARRSAITTQRIAASVCGLGLSAYMSREADQDSFKMRELKKLYKAVGTDGKDTIADWLVKNFPDRLQLK